MGESDALVYVNAAAPLVGLRLTPERAAEVAAAFLQVQRFAGPALACEVPHDAEPAPAFHP